MDTTESGERDRLTGAWLPYGDDQGPVEAAVCAGWHRAGREAFLAGVPETSDRYAHMRPAAHRWWLAGWRLARHLAA